MEVRDRFFFTRPRVRFGILLCIGFSLWAIPSQAQGTFEVSLGASYNRTNFSGDSYNWNRRYGLSLAYHFTERSGIEFSFQDVVDRTKIVGFEDTTFHDRVYGANWIQSFTGRDSFVQPYFRAGVGVLNREANGVYAAGTSPPSRLDSITALFGLGFRFYVTKQFAIRAEGTSYLTGGRISTWRDNFASNLGISVYF